MKKLGFISFVALISMAACKKEKKGICHCSYLSGDKKDYDLSSLPENRQQDSCRVLDGYASAFAGSCKVK